MLLPGLKAAQQASAKTTGRIRCPRPYLAPTMSRALRLLAIIGIALLVFFLTREFYRPEAAHERTDSTVLLERIRPVLKLVTVEGDFSELYVYQKGETRYEWLNSFTPFQKKAILRVKGRASVGYDLEQLGLEVDESSFTVRLKELGAPTLLSLEHDVDYFNMEEGSFSRFTAGDHTRIQREAKGLIRDQVAKSGLYSEAEKRRGEMLTIVKALVEQAGWTYDGPQPPPSSLVPADHAPKL